MMFLYKINYMDDYYNPPMEDTKQGILHAENYVEAMQILWEYYGDQILSIKLEEIEDLPIEISPKEYKQIKERP